MSSPERCRINRAKLFGFELALEKSPKAPGTETGASLAANLRGNQEEFRVGGVPKLVLLARYGGKRPPSGRPEKGIECQQDWLYRQEATHLRCRSFMARSHDARSGPLRFLHNRPSCLCSELQSCTQALCPPGPCRRFIPGIRGIEFPGFPGFPTEGGGPPAPRPLPLPCGTPPTTAETRLK